MAARSKKPRTTKTPDLPKTHTYAKVTKRVAVEPEARQEDQAEEVLTIIASEPPMDEAASNTNAAMLNTVAHVNEAASVETIQQRRHSRVWLWGMLLVLLLAAGILGIMKYQKMQAAKNPSYAAEVKAKDLLSKVGRLTVLPTGENPTIAVVSDVNKLPKAPLFVDARNGDEVLVYTNAHKAYVYRPSTDKVIAIGPITIASNNPQTTSSSASASVTMTPARVMIWNGTDTAGLARKAQAAVTAKDTVITVTGVGDAAVKTYTKTLVIDLTGKNSTQATTIAGIMKGTVAALPKSETKPSASDILIILGTDYAGSK